MTLTDSGALKTIIEAAYKDRDSVNSDSGGDIRRAIEASLSAMGKGQLRVAEKTNGEWVVNEWLKKAILLYFRLTTNQVIGGGPDGAPWFDKMGSKFEGWGESEFVAAGFRAVPGAFVRPFAYVAPGAVLMPSFVNLGAHVSAGVMVDSWATIGSCAQIGKNVHVSANVMIGGVLEPLQAFPVIIEDDCFVGAGVELAEGVVVEEGSVLAMGVSIGASTKIVDRQTGEVHVRRVPSYSVVVPGALPGKPALDGSPPPSLSCAVIVKRVDEQTRAKTSINDLLRD